MQSTTKETPAGPVHSSITETPKAEESELIPPPFPQMMKNFGDMLRKTVEADKEYEPEQAEIFKGRLTYNLGHEFKGQTNFCYQIGVGVNPGWGLAYEYDWIVNSAPSATPIIIDNGKLISKGVHNCHELIHEWTLEVIKELPCFSVEMKRLDQSKTAAGLYTHVVIVKVSDTYLKNIRKEVYGKDLPEKWKDTPLPVIEEEDDELDNAIAKGYILKKSNKKSEKKHNKK